MIAGVLEKITREIWLTLVLFVAGLGAATGLITLMLPDLQQGFNEVLVQVPFLKAMASAMLGIDVREGVTARMMLAIAWSHPIILTLLWAYEIIHCTRIPAGEVDRGTIEILLGWPVARRTLYLVESGVWLVAGVLLIGGILTGYSIAASTIAAENRPAYSAVLLVACNLLCIYLAVGGVAYVVSSLESRRGRAMTIVFAIVVASFFVNFLAQFWTPAEPIAILSLMNYYQPAQVLLEQRVPIDHVLALIAIALITWTIGASVTIRRDLAVM